MEVCATCHKPVKQMRCGQQSRCKCHDREKFKELLERFMDDNDEALKRIETR